MIATVMEDPEPPKKPPTSSELGQQNARTGLSGVPANHAASLIFDSPNLDRRGGFTTGISLRESVRTQPQRGNHFTLFISIPHLGPAQGPAGLQEVPVDSKTLQEYRFMGMATPSPAKVPEEIVRVYQTWFLLFDNGSLSCSHKPIEILIDIDTIGIFRSADDELATRAPLFPFQDRRGGMQALVHMLSNSITVLEKPALIALRDRASDLVLSSTALFLNGNDWLTKEHRNRIFGQAYKRSAEELMRQQIRRQPGMRRPRRKLALQRQESK